MTPPIFTPEITFRGRERIKYTDADDARTYIEQEVIDGNELLRIGKAILDRDRVATIVLHLSHWLETGSLMIVPDATVEELGYIPTADAALELDEEGSDDA